MKRITFSSIILLLFIFSSVESYSQGFGGKRLFAGYNLSMFHATAFSDYAPTGTARNYKAYDAWNVTHHLELEYVLGRLHVLGVNYFRYRTNEGLWGDSYPDYLHLNVQGYGFYYKIFSARKGSIAPIGTWWKFQLSNMHCRAVEILDPGNTDNSTRMDFRIAFGKQIPIFSGLLLNMSAETAIPISELSTGQGYLEPGGYYWERLDSYNGINVKIGLSLPLY